MENSKLPQLCEDAQCTGCMACVNSCNSGALSVTTSKEGFYRPLLNEDKCVGCGLCQNACPVVNVPQKNKKEDLRVFAAWHNQALVRRSSSSGGVFTALAELVLEKGGVVFGAAYTDDFQIIHIEIHDKNELEKLCLSKYAQSKVGETMLNVRELLKEGKYVMFVGTPCQVAGLKSFLKKEYENLLAVDFICHGVPSALFLQSWVKWIEGKYGKITGLNFRDKRKGWYDGMTVIRNANGKDKVLRGLDSGYMTAFNKNNCLQESCYECKAQGFPRCSDMTIADFWQIGQAVPFGHKDEIEKGVSMIVVNNPSKMDLVAELKGRAFIEERTVEEAISGNMAAVRSSHRPSSRDKIYTDLLSMNYDEFANQYLRGTRKQKLVKLFREYFPFSIIKFVRLSKQK